MMTLLLLTSAEPERFALRAAKELSTLFARTCGIGCLVAKSITLLSANNWITLDICLSPLDVENIPRLVEDAIQIVCEL